MAELEDYRGSTITIELSLSEYTPFSGYALSDGDSAPTITVTDPNGTAVVDAASMTNSATGKYYYLLKTLTSWRVGDYKIEVNATISANNEVEIVKEAIKLLR